MSSMKYLLMAFAIIIALLIESCSGFPGFLSKQAIFCKNKLNQVSNINELSQFLQRINLGMELHGYRYKFIRHEAQCLGIDFTNLEMFLKTFILAIDVSTNGKACEASTVSFLVNTKLYSSKIKEKQIIYWIDKLIRQTIVKCKQMLPDSLRSAERQEIGTTKVVDALKHVVDFAQNFNWLDESHFPPNDGIQIKSYPAIELAQKSLDQMEQLVPTSKRIEDVIRVIYMVTEQKRRVKRGKKAPIYNWISESIFQGGVADQQERFQRLYEGCQIVWSYYVGLIEPVVALTLVDNFKGTKQDDPIRSYEHINSWLASTQLCLLIEDIYFYKYLDNKQNPPVTTYQLKLNKDKEDDNLNEGLTPMIEHVYHKLIEEFELKRELAAFKDIDPNLDEIIWRESELFPFTLRIPSKLKPMYKSYVSPKFLKVIADYIEA